MHNLDRWWRRFQRAVNAFVSAWQANDHALASITQAGGPATGHQADAYIRYGLAISAWATFERAVDIAVWIALGVDLDLAPAITDQVQSVRSKLIIVDDCRTKKRALTEKT